MRNVASAIGIVLVAALSTGLAQDAGSRPRLTFSAADKSFEAAAGEYRRIWAEDGNRIIEALERSSRLKFPEREIGVEVFEGVSNSGRRGLPMKLRASYAPQVKKGVLLHELGHRMNAQLRRRPADADEQVAFDKTLKGRYDYEAAWDWAFAMTKEERASKFAEVRRANQK